MNTVGSITPEVELMTRVIGLLINHLAVLAITYYAAV